VRFTAMARLELASVKSVRWRTYRRLASVNDDAFGRLLNGGIRRPACCVTVDRTVK